jgi:membrane protein DedA with SNARE-associated domain/membrane-associated phospholipid phosphatase
MLDHLIHFVDRLGHWGYLLIFLGAMLESAAFLGLLIPGESLVLVAGFFAAQGLLDLDVLIVIVGIGAALGDSLGYELGRRLGRPALKRYGNRFGLNNARIEKAEVFFKRHGGKAVFLGRFVGFARALVPFLAGSSKMPYRQFITYNALGAALWAPAVVLLGYVLGASWQTAGRWIGRASAILGGIVVFILILLWMWRWSVRHEAAIKRQWINILQQPRIKALRRRFAPQITFVQARLSPQGYFGAQMTAGALLLIGASWLFGGISEDVLTGDPLTIVDLNVAEWFHAHATPLVTQFMMVFTNLHGVVAISSYAALLALYLVWKRDWYWLGCLGATVPGGMLLNVLMKFAFQRARPSFDNPLLTLPTYSFPSGHVAGTALFYGVLGAMLVSKITAWRWRVFIVFAAIALVLLVALSRVYLGVHYLSDVLAAFAEAVAWLSLCLMGIHTFWQHRVEGKRPLGEAHG